jgi:hypothetical protein
MGEFGKPKCFRIPGEGMDGSIIVLPRVDGRELEVVVGLEDGKGENSASNVLTIPT